MGGVALKAAIYVRKSKYTGKGESIANQIDLCKQYATSHNYQVLDELIYYDEGFSGSNTDRPAFKRLLADINKKQFNVLICYRLDRISRSISDFSTILELLEAYNIDFVSIKEQFDTSTPIGRAMIYIASIFAQLERETTAERIRDNMLQLARTGRWLGGNTPTGYKSEKISYTDEDGNKRYAYKLTEVSREKQIIVTLFKQYLKTKSLSEVEKYCDERKILTKNNKPFHKTQIRSILINPVYAIADAKLYDYFISINCDLANKLCEFDGLRGIMVYNKTHKRKHRSNFRRDPSEWIVALGLHNGFISSTDWIEVQRLLSNNIHKASRTGNSSIALLSGLIHCKECGSPMRVTYGHELADGSVPHYYACSLRLQSKGEQCSNANLNGLLADRFCIEAVFKPLNTTSKLKKHLLNHRDSLSFSSDREKVRIEKDFLSDDFLINKFIIQAISRYVSSGSIPLQQPQQKRYFNNMKSVDELVYNFACDIKKEDIECLRNTLASLISDITWDGDTLDIKILGG